MNECSKQQIKCPRCHYDSPMTVWNYINADLDPGLKEKLLNGDLYHWKCEVCGLEFDVQFSSLYLDMMHKFMLFFSPTVMDMNKYNDIELPIPSGIEFKRYTFRSVFGINELREKISIFESELNDVAIERMKFFLKLSSIDGLFPDDALFFLGIDSDPEKIKSYDWGRGVIKFMRLREGKEPKILHFPMEKYYDYLLAVNLDPRMKPFRYACVDENWIKMKLQQK